MMHEPPIPSNEAERLKSLRELDAVSGWPAGALDGIAHLAARCFRAPIATVTLVEAEHECYVGAFGTEPGTSDRRASFCGYVVLEGGLLVVPDAAVDERFKDNPLVKELGIRSYLGVAITAPDGHKVGALCIKDTRPRYFGEDDVRALRLLADMVSREFSLRELNRGLEAARARTRESERRFRTLADESPMMVWTADADGRCDYFNKGWLDFTGRPMSEQVGEGWASCVHPDDLPGCLEAWNAAVAEHRVFEARYRLRRADGAYRWIVDRGGPRADDAGVFQGFVGSCVDIDDLIRTQEDLRRARDAAESSSRAKSEFLTVMSHEIRTPLTAILGYTDLLEETGDPARAPAERMDYISTIRRNGVRLLSMVTDLLDLASLEKGELTPRVAPFDAAQALREATEPLELLAREKRLSLTAELPDRALVRSDAEILRRVVRHVVNNAVKFTQTGSVRIRARGPSADTAGCLVVEVDDTGIGMTPEQLDKAFGPFGKADVSMSRHVGGAGVGLPLCRRLLSLLGGEISADSRPGRGSTFTIRVPSKPEEAQTLQAPASGPLHGVRVLVAEDGADNQRLLHAFLRKAGAEVVLVENGQRAVDQFRAHAASGTPFDLVLMDMQMPIKDGYSAARELKDGGATAPIVAVTAHALHEDRDRCLAAGCDEFLTKPIDRAELVSLCSRMVRPAAEAAE